MNRSRAFATALALALLVSVPAFAADDHMACDMPPTYVPAELLTRPVPLRQGIGNTHETVDTKSPEAQAYYDQGLNYLESYVWIEASRSFQQALRLDPELAMAWIGLSRVHSGLDDTTGARRAFEKAKALAAKASPRVQRRIEIREKQLAAIAAIDDPGKLNAYRKAIDDALAQDLNDSQLWLLRGNAEEPTASGRGQRGAAASIACYEKVLALVPDHASAHHFLIHSYENGGSVEKALEHGAAYARLSPAIPHAAHMWAHDLRRVGRVDQAIEQFALADRLENEYYAAEKLDPALDWHHGHNLDLLAACYQHKGQMELAEKTMRDCAKLSPVDAYRAFNAKELPHFLIHRGRYEEALTSARAMTEALYPQARCIGHVLAGHASIALGRTAAAETELDAARRELELVPRVTLNLVPRRAVLEPWVEGLRGELLLRTGRTEEARTVLEGVIRGLRATPGPDAWVQALFRMESIGRSAREAGDWTLAAFVATQMLDHDAAYGGSHLAQALVLKHQNDRAGSAKEIELARKYWQDADPKLAERKLLAVR